MNKNIFRTLLACAICFTLVFNESCKKKDDPTPTPTPTPVQPTNAPPQYKPSDGAGALTAVQTVSFQNVPTVGPVEIDLGLGVAVFTNNSFSSFVDGGTVNLNSNALTIQSNNAYVYTPATGSTTGIDFSSGITWAVTGNSANAVPAISQTVTANLPSVSDIDNSGTVATTGSFTLKTTSGISGADSTYFTIAGPNASIQKLVGGSTQQVTFTASEMASLGTGSNAGLLQIAPFNFETHMTGGKKYYYIQEKVISKFVTLQ